MALLNSIILPSEIKEDYFKEFYKELEEILIENQEYINTSKIPFQIDVFCDGFGGEWNAVMSVINTIEAFSRNSNIRFNGIVQSNAISGHSMIWSAIPNRTMSKMAEISIHDAAFIAGDEPLYYAKIVELGKQAQRKLNILASIYSNACSIRKFNKQFWFDEIYASEGELIHLTYSEVKTRGMITYE